jgi:FAD/FMN-containing dehydrogenase
MSRGRWKNWAENRESDAELVTPRSLDELSALVRRVADADNKCLRATGGGFSWSPLVQYADTIVSMKALDRVLAFDASAGSIEVECGIRIEALEAWIRPRGFTLVSPPLFPMPSVGGVVATGSHGADSARGNFSDQILEMKLVRADGSVQSVRRGDPEFPAAQVALGSLGVLYSVTLELAPQFSVYVDKRYVPVSYVLDEFEDLRKSCEFLEIFWFPQQKKMWLYLMHRTRTRPDPETWRTRLYSAWDTAVEGFAANWLIPKVARRLPRYTPVLNRVASRLSNKAAIRVRSASDAFHHQKVYPRNWDLSYAVPATSAARAWSEGIALVDYYARSRLYPVNLALHCRFTGASGAWIAPNYDRETCYIEVATARGTPGWVSFFREMENRWISIEGARPHWGKLYWRWSEIFGRYAQMNEFLNVRQRWDPKRVFLNGFLEQAIFGLPLRPGVTPRAFRSMPGFLADE